MVSTIHNLAGARFGNIFESGDKQCISFDIVEHVERRVAVRGQEHLSTTVRDRVGVILAVDAQSLKAIRELRDVAAQVARSIEGSLCAYCEEHLPAGEQPRPDCCASCNAIESEDEERILVLSLERAVSL